MRHLLLLTTLLLSGCVTSQQVESRMQKCLGYTLSELIVEWGPPAQVLDDGEGGKIVVFDRSSNTTMPGSSYTTGSSYGYGTRTYDATTFHNPPQTINIRRSRVFFLNAEGRVIRYSWKGL